MSQAATSPTPPASAPDATTGFGARLGTGAHGWHLVHALACGPGAAGLLEVHSRAEHPPGVAEHDHPRRVVGQRDVQVCEELAAQLGGQRVAVGGGVQGDRRDARRDIEVHQLRGAADSLMRGR
jgi:hypothetical protein